MWGSGKADAAIERVGLASASPAAIGSLRGWLLDQSEVRKHNNLGRSLLCISDQKLHTEYKDGRWLVNLKKLCKEGLLESVRPSPFKTCENVSTTLLFNCFVFMSER